MAVSATPTVHDVSFRPAERGGFGGFILLVLRLVLGGLFVFAAYVKLTGPLDFSDSVKAFKILPDHLAQLATFAVPWTEMVCGLALIVGCWTRSAALLVSVLLAVFIAGIISVLWRGLTVNCGCFGKLQPFCTGPLGWCNIGQNAGMLGMGLVLAVFGGGLLSVDRALAGRGGAVPGRETASKPSLDTPRAVS
ncbi:MAG: DoxX family membrane protein [Phycisphaerales bacterium]|nr:DoxX family membrane protein [Phycisphaerales bacterium]